MPSITAERVQTHRFVPHNADIADPDQVSLLYDALEAQEIDTTEALLDFIFDWEELNAAIYDCRTEAYIDMTSDTTNPDFQARYTLISDKVLPVVEQRGFALKRKLLGSPAVDSLGDEFEVYLRNIRSEVELFSEANVPLLADERTLDQEFQQISGKQKAEFRGQVYTLQQLLPFIEEPSRVTREEAWRARSEARLNDAAVLDELYDRMYEVRRRIARNAGVADYREYKFKEMKRFDYTPDDCLAFHEAIEKHVVPVVSADYERRKRLLGVETLRPWDLLVDPEGKPPLRPYSSIAELEAGCQRIFDRLDPQLGGFFRTMVQNSLLDLDNRPGKAPGGYMEQLPDRRVPFIFMNAVGVKYDVDTLLHESGHAFHYFLARDLPLFSYHYSGIEFMEVASMSMELLTRPYMSEFYTREELARLLDEQIRQSLSGIPHIAMSDAFQHWVYTAGNPDAAARRAKWAELEQRFRPSIDWSGLEEYRDIGWQFLHIFSVPFYYIEYAIAQLAALRVWLNSLQDERGTLEAYKRALSLGGSRPLPELFAVSGAGFSFDDQAVGETIRGTVEQITKD